MYVKDFDIFSDCDAHELAAWNDKRLFIDEWDHAWVVLMWQASKGTVGIC